MEWDSVHWAHAAADPSNLRATNPSINAKSSKSICVLLREFTAVHSRSKNGSPDRVLLFPNAAAIDALCTNSVLGNTRRYSEWTTERCHENAVLGSASKARLNAALEILLLSDPRTSSNISLNSVSSRDVNFGRNNRRIARWNSDERPLLAASSRSASVRAARMTRDVAPFLESCIETRSRR